MLSFVARRALAIVPLIVIATAAAFFMLQLSDVDPAVVKLGETATEEQYTVVRAELGTDRPAVVQYADWLVHSAQLDFGESWQRPVEVTTLIRQRLPATLSLTLGAVLVTVLLGLPLGVAAGIRAGSGADSLITAGASIGQAVPAFWAALLLAAYVSAHSSFASADVVAAFAASPSAATDDRSAPKALNGASCARRSS